MELFGIHLFTFIFGSFLICRTNAELAFTAKQWETFIPGFYSKSVFMGESLEIDCGTNDPKAVVKLNEKKGAVYTNAIVAKQGRLTQNGQKFVLNPVEKIDSTAYQCEASVEAEIILLELGMLTMHPKHNVKVPPEVYPANQLSIQLGTTYAIICKTTGSEGIDKTIIEWYKEADDGNSIKLDGKHTDEKLPDKSIIDVVSYTFTDFQKEDSGKFICKKTLVSPGTGASYTLMKSIKVDLEEPVSPKVSLPGLEGDTYSVDAGARLNITCIIIGSPSPSKTWFKGSTKHTECESHQYASNFCELVITKTAHPRDSGLYKCVGENSLGNAVKNVTVIVKVAPSLKKPSKEYIATYKEEKSLTCELEQNKGFPLPVISWQVQDDTCTDDVDCIPLAGSWKDIDEDQSPEKNTATSKSTIISKPTKKNSFYRCIAKNVVGQDIYSFKLTRTEKKKVVFDFEAESNPINEEDALKLNCIIDNLKFESALIKKVGSATSLQVSQKTEGDNTVLTFIKPVAELSDSGEYECEATQTRGGTQNKTLDVTVKKLVAPAINGFVRRKLVNQDEERNIVINCEVSGNPFPSVSWKFNGTVLQKTKINGIKQCDNMRKGVYVKAGSPNTLIICGLEFEAHSGDYSCTATNKVNTVTKLMYLNVEGSPKFSKSWQDEIKVGLKKPVVLYCVTSANPPAKIKWLRVDNNKTTFVGAGINYEIPEVTKKNAGIYECLAGNKLGNVTRRVRLFVAGIETVTSASSSDKGTIIGIIVAFSLLLIIILIVILLYRRHLKKRYALYLEPKKDFSLDPDRSLFEQSSELPYDMAWEYPRERLTFIKTLGSGAFGQVWLAEAEGIYGFKPRDTSIGARKRRKSIQKTQRYHRMSFRYKKASQQAELISLEKSMVAVKTLKEDAAEGEYKDLASELKILIHLGENKNIVNLLGACTTGGKLCVILECCPHGSLLTFLRARRETFDRVWQKHEVDMEKEFTYIDLVMIAWQVAKGMDFLQTKKCVHRDLAARNVLVGPDYIMKIADFGLARDIYKDEFYLKETTGLLPVKWMAPESLFDKVYTSSSDVWSFGILLWEIFTLGGSPYPGLPTEDLFNFLEEGKRMDCPEKCPKDIYGIMYDCWTKSPYERPLFSQVVERLNNVMKQNVSEGTADEYFDFTDNAQDNYLTPEEYGKMKHGVSSEYLEATAPDATHRKGDGHVPLLTEVIDDVDNEKKNEDLPALPDDRYVPLPSDDHYLVPNSNRRGSFESV